MTTIAYRDGVIAADTMEVTSNSIIGVATKIARRDDGCLAGAAGDAVYSRAFLQWFEGGEKGNVPEGFSEDGYIDRGVIFRPNGIIEVYEPRGMFETTAPYYAIGSGRPEALGAMFVGADPEAAVRAAIAHDVHTGGEVIVLRSEESKQRREVA